MTQMLPQIRASNIKPIAVTSAERSEAAPDVPTLQEAGLSDYEVLQWWGVLAPAGLPEETVAKLNTDINRSEEHTSELQSLMRISYAVFCLKKKKQTIKSKK